MRAIHLGVKLHNLAYVQSSLRGLIRPGLYERTRVIVGGDGWFSWGDPLGQAGNDADTLHVVVEIPGKWSHALVHAAIAHPLRPVLEPMPDDSATYWVLTKAKDWSKIIDVEEFLTVHRVFEDRKMTILLTVMPLLAHLGARAEWDSEDNAYVTETIAGLAQRLGLPTATDQDKAALKFWRKVERELERRRV